MVQIILILLLFLSFVLHFFVGPVPVSIFAFPLNVILLALWCVLVIWSWRKSRKSLFVIFMLSSSATFWAIGLLLAFCLTIGLTGMRWITNTWPFVFVLTYFITVLAYVLMRGLRAATPTGARLGGIRWRFIFIHAGLLIALISGFAGAPDNEERSMRIFIDKQGHHGDDIRLLDFHLESYDNGVPSEFRADMMIDGNEVTLMVNHPYSRKFGQDVYLTGYDIKAGAESEYCVIQIVNDPWRYGVTAGIVMMIIGALMLFIGGPRRRYSNDIE